MYMAEVYRVEAVSDPSPASPSFSCPSSSASSNPPSHSRYAVGEKDMAALGFNRINDVNKCISELPAENGRETFLT